MEDAGVLWGIIGLLAGALGSLLADRFKRTDTTLERGGERAVVQGELMAGVLTRLAVLERDSHKCDALAERATRLETWRDMASIKIEESYEGLRAVARLDERMRTLFTMVGEIKALIGSKEGAAHG